MSYNQPDIDTLGYIQCVTCGKVIGNLYERADEWRRKNFTEMEVYQKLGLKRACCRYHLTLGIKMPMVKYLDEHVRLDLNESVEEDVVQKPIKNLQSDSDKVSMMKNRLSRLKDSKIESICPVSEEPSTNSKRISFFVAT
jgi:DNA-directed RNA polymerase subunit N (RpoN/RPB10)